MEAVKSIICYVSSIFSDDEIEIIDLEEEESMYSEVQDLLYNIAVQPSPDSEDDQKTASDFQSSLLETAKKRAPVQSKDGSRKISEENLPSIEETASTVSCRICLERFKELCRKKIPLTMTSCGHVYCQPCMTSWIKTRCRSCPVCRCRMTSKSTRTILIN